MWMWESARPLRFSILFLFERWDNNHAYYGLNSGMSFKSTRLAIVCSSKKLGEISLGRPRGRTDERRRRPALSHGPRKVAVLTNDMGVYKY